MILRLWRGWTAPDNADRYEELIAQTIFPGILGQRIAGLHGVELFRRPIDGEVEFMTLMRFEFVGGGEGLRRAGLGGFRRAAVCARGAGPLRRTCVALRSPCRASSGRLTHRLQFADQPLDHREADLPEAGILRVKTERREQFAI